MLVRLIKLMGLVVCIPLLGIPAGPVAHSMAPAKQEQASQDNKTKEHVMDPQNQLQQYLQSRFPDEEYRIRPLKIEVPGWHFFEGTRTSVRGSHIYWVVRDDGTLVSREEKSAELGKIFRALEVSKRPDDQKPETLAVAAVALLVNRQILIGAPLAQQLAQRHPNCPLAEPRLSQTDQGVLLEFWTKGTGRRAGLIHNKVTVGEDGSVSHEADDTISCS